MTTTTNREIDLDGFIEIKNNPISKVGVFPYSGKQISSDLPPNKIYYVYRPAEELSNQDCIDSFKLKPFIDEHEMLGKNFTPAEQKGVHGVIGENIYFDGNYLKANLKIFSEDLADLINGGKKEVSLGYRCRYEPARAFFKGKRYDFIQRDIRGNHIALVQEGRCGSDVAVLDRFTFDAAELTKMSNKLTLETLDEKLNTLVSVMDELKLALDKKAKDDDEDKKDKEDKKSMDEDEEKEDKKSEDEKEDDKKTEDEEMETKKSSDKKSTKDEVNHGEGLANQRWHGKDSKAFDANEFKREVLKEINAKNELADQLSWHIGTFDHAEKTLDEVANYGLKKLGLSSPRGAEKAVLQAYLTAKKQTNTAFAIDSSENKSALSKFISKYRG